MADEEGVYSVHVELRGVVTLRYRLEDLADIYKRDELMARIRQDTLADPHAHIAVDASDIDTLERHLSRLQVEKITDGL